MNMDWSRSYTFNVGQANALQKYNRLVSVVKVTNLQTDVYFNSFLVIVLYPRSLFLYYFFLVEFRDPSNEVISLQVFNSRTLLFQLKASFLDKSVSIFMVYFHLIDLMVFTKNRVI